MLKFFLRKPKWPIVTILNVEGGRICSLALSKAEQLSATAIRYNDKRTGMLLINGLPKTCINIEFAQVGHSHFGSPEGITLRLVYAAPIKGENSKSLISQKLRRLRVNIMRYLNYGSDNKRPNALYIMPLIILEFLAFKKSPLMPLTLSIVLLII